MKLAYPRFNRVGLIACALELMLSCSYKTNLIPISTRKSDVRLKVSPDHGRFLGPYLFTCLRVDRTNAPVGLIWSAHDRSGTGQHVKEVRYGVAPVGFTERAPAKPIQVGDHVLVEIGCHGVTGRVEFVVSED
ncbi:MAG TPA: hypothetical protein VFQ61_19620 [Polyangiaceae bacterium]|nr:hypothetical protein [Polyangiaceae bacterium]